MTDTQPSPQLPPGSDQNRAPAYQAFLIFLTILVTVVIILRFYSRALGPRHTSGQSVHRFWWDDWVALLSVFLILIYFGLAFAEVHLGFGRHIWMVKPANLPVIFKILYCIYFFYDVSLFFTKVSALLFLSRLFPRHLNSAWWNSALWAAHGLNIAWFMGIVFGTVFMCNPVEKGWNPMLSTGTCGTTSALWMGSAIPSVIIDLIILLLPLPKILGLHTSRTRKAGLLLVFILGYGVIVVSLGRLITVLKSGEALNKDITYEGMPMVYWVTAEAPTTLVCICLPPMLNLCRYLAASYITPWSNKLSSFLSSRGSGSGDLSSKDSKLNSTTGLSTSGNTNKSYINQPVHGNHYNHLDGERSVHSMESRSRLVVNDSQTPARLHGETTNVKLDNLKPHQDQYVASVESGGLGSVPGDNNATGHQIRVNRDISVSRHASHF